MTPDRYEENLRSAYFVIAEQQNRLEDDERNMRAARRQVELFMEDGTRERLTVALALLDDRGKTMPHQGRHR